MALGDERAYVCHSELPGASDRQIFERDHNSVYKARHEVKYSGACDEATGPVSMIGGEQARRDSVENTV